MASFILTIYLLITVWYLIFIVILHKLFKLKELTMYKLIRYWAIGILKVLRVKVHVKHQERLLDDASLIVSNHLGYFDIITMAHLFDDTIAFIGKKELFKIPVLKQMMLSVHCQALDREDIKQNIKVINDASKILKNGQNMVIFPEGTRTKEDLDFKAGSFKIATKAKATITPITIRNTSALYEDNKKIKRQPIYVYVHQPITYEDYKDMDINTLAKTIQEKIQAIEISDIAD